MRPHGEPGPSRPPGDTPPRAGTGPSGPWPPRGPAHGAPPPGPGRGPARPDHAPGVPAHRPAGAPPPGGPGHGTPPPGGPRPGGVVPPPAPASAPPAGSEASSDEERTAGSLLAGADGFASRPPRQRNEPPPTTGSLTDGIPGPGGRHRRGGPTEEPAPDPDDPMARFGRRTENGKGKGKKKTSFWRELPLLIVVAVVLTFTIQTFVGRIYVIPSASMEQTLHGCEGCSNDRVGVDKLTYRFGDPAPGDVVVFRGPPAWASNDEVAGERSGNVVTRGLQDAASLIGLAPPNEKDFVKRVVAVGGQKVQCCDPQNRVLVDDRPLTEPYLYYEEGLEPTQEPFDPVTVPNGQLWVMGDNRNNSADARVHGPISIDDVIGKARAIVLPVSRWSGVPDLDPQNPGR